ncbi:hypothetical protein IMG5_021850 [Ichthyophthirius multifiliis]|uniref:Uncharacterized protein n=1 Tax=Ichthyophthirius multifiliis TaxID=5932 RepID=G0QKU1_ICHMU|nr:hypothetical protein IMG5_021850 [Ichthyophthirius multifiliis]EGR34165.1 hypothetical protein IMG5_021850 [Ichthyophthirius multifiliis]|eukprot:XP_004039469.1 hypothetical protein IMG5_021850 [Ichthyophthirius multifiliis]
MDVVKAHLIQQQKIIYIQIYIFLQKKHLLKDCECIVDYLRIDLKQQKIGIHGQSIGGMIACYVAYSKKLDFLIADRTFSQISDIGQYRLGNKSKQLFRFLTNWDLQINTSYLNCSCYKVISFDIKDDIIPYQASLQNGVSKQYIFNHLNSLDYQYLKSIKQSNGFYSQVKNYFIAKKLQYKKALQNEKQPQIENHIENFISINDYNSLFNSIRRIIEIIVEISKYRTVEHNTTFNSFLNDENNRLNRSISVPESRNKPQKIIDIPLNNQNPLNENIKSDKQFQDFIINCFTAFDKFDSGGLTIASIFTAFQQNQQYEIFKVIFIYQYFYFIFQKSNLF